MEQRISGEMYFFFNFSFSCGKGPPILDLFIPVRLLVILLLIAADLCRLSAISFNCCCRELLLPTHGWQDNSWGGLWNTRLWEVQINFSHSDERVWYKKYLIGLLSDPSQFFALNPQKKNHYLWKLAVITSRFCNLEVKVLFKTYFLRIWLKMFVSVCRVWYLLLVHIFFLREKHSLISLSV